MDGPSKRLFRQGLYFFRMPRGHVGMDQLGQVVRFPRRQLYNSFQHGHGPLGVGFVGTGFGIDLDQDV